ncbi:hypothetical protein HC024_12940 [Methylococcaceae bacterium WWC4]|nr:hypothetical protein [Methylococcaceae bacterium WWC4]
MNNKDQSLIEGKESIISELGYWPEFCDAKVIQLEYFAYTDSGAKLSVVLHYIDMDMNRDLCVKFTFHGVFEMDFQDFKAENVIDKLSISNFYIVYIEAATGLSGYCKCKAIDVNILSSKQYLVD